ERKGCPMDDIVTKLVQADVDGEALSSDEFGFFVILLAVAGNETTRNAITHGMKAFMDNPQQWELYKQHRPKTAPDEIVRWASPVMSFQRTATADTELGGQHIRKGDRVGMFYSSANFDPEVFDEPYKFDIMRENNPHVGFGGTGAHYCVGANLARLEIDLMFNAIADAMPNIREVSEPDRLRSSWLNGIKHYQVASESPLRGGLRATPPWRASTGAWRCVSTTRVALSAAGRRGSGRCGGRDGRRTHRRWRRGRA